ncbi:hypothetical protein EJD97_021456 [Solanum chilense]|uniref:Uncharacterized protein n=1 Tax=Solanum chilense TaxID=4083 RepID=A0A6N2AGU4_SOLCI|nr:hypothetical protein EJD97_021456 [Solanum chilense]
MPCPTSSNRVCYPRAIMSKGEDGMSRPTLSDHVRCPMAIMTCHARRHLTGNDVIQRPTLSDRLCSARAIMSCHADLVRPCVWCPSAMMVFHTQRHPTMYAAQGPFGHSTPDVIIPLSQYKGDDCMPRSTLFDRVYCPRTMLT